MTQFLNPAVIGDFSGAGLSSGVATESLVYAAGLALDPVTTRRRGDAATISDEVQICLENIGTILAEAGLTLDDVVKTTCYLRSDDYRREFIHAYRAAFNPHRYPARCTFVLGLASDLRVQIEAVAVRPAQA